MLKKFGMYFLDDQLFQDSLYKVVFEEFAAVLMTNKALMQVHMERNI